MHLPKVLEKLSNACGVAGREEEVRDLMKEMLKPYVDELREDKLGNVIGIKHAKKKKSKRKPLSVMFAAHMDEIGLLVKTITKDGFLQFYKIGGIDDRILLAQRVIVHTRKKALPGIIGSRPPHIQKTEERKKIVEANQLFIDIGAKNKEEARKLGVQIGDPVSFDSKFTKIGKNIVIGKAFDDRVGCAVMIETMKQLDKVNCTVYAVGTVQEEVGLRGATVAAFGIHPDVGLAFDVTVAGDVPGVKEVEAPIKMGMGPSLTIADSGLIAHPKVLQLLVETAEENKIPYQLETGLPGSTDAARIALSREGVPSGVISIPTRYIHSPTAMLNLSDVENAVKLAVAAVHNIPKHF